MIGLFVYGEVSLSLFTAYGVILAFKLLCFMHLKLSAIDVIRLPFLNVSCLFLILKFFFGLASLLAAIDGLSTHF
jgi:hypothetical protein